VPNPCFRSDLLRAFQRHVLRMLGALDIPPPNGPAVTLISRRDYPHKKVWGNGASESGGAFVFSLSPIRALTITASCSVHTAFSRQSASQRHHFFIC